MKITVRKEWGDWVIEADGNPIFGFAYKDEAQKVADMIDALIMCYDFIQELKDHGIDNWSYEPELKKVLTEAGVLIEHQTKEESLTTK